MKDLMPEINECNNTYDKLFKFGVQFIDWRHGLLGDHLVELVHVDLDFGGVITPETGTDASPFTWHNDG